MARTYKRVTGKKSRSTVDMTVIRKAIEDVGKGMTISAAARKYNIPRSNLSKRIKNSEIRNRVGRDTALSLELEAGIAARLGTCADWGYPLDLKETANIISAYLQNNDIVVERFKNNKPGPDYLHGFYERNKGNLTIRLCSNIKRSRAAVDFDCIKSYFDQLTVSLTDVPKENIFNYDETNFSDDPGRKKVIAKRKSKYVERVMNWSKSATSVMFAVNASGFVLPPYVVYKAKHLYTSWTEGGPTGTRYNRSKSGWFDSVTFLDWLQTVIIPHLRKLDGPKFLIGDNLSTHISLEAIQLCETYNIKFIFLPSNSTHLLQPLDVATYAPLKRQWRSILNEWKTKEGQSETCVSKHIFPKLLKRLCEELKDSMPKNVISGFRKCGIAPLSFDQMISRFPESIRQNAQQDQPDMNHNLDNSFIQFLEVLRPHSKSSQSKKKKINVPPGKSVSAEDFQNLEPQPHPSDVPTLKKRGRPSKKSTAT